MLVTLIDLNVSICMLRRSASRLSFRPRNFDLRCGSLYHCCLSRHIEGDSYIHIHMCVRSRTAFHAPTANVLLDASMVQRASTYVDTQYYAHSHTRIPLTAVSHPLARTHARVCVCVCVRYMRICIQLVESIEVCNSLLLSFVIVISNLFLSYRFHCSCFSLSPSLRFFFFLLYLFFISFYPLISLSLSSITLLLSIVRCFHRRMHSLREKKRERVTGGREKDKKIPNRNREENYTHREREQEKGGKRIWSYNKM